MSETNVELINLTADIVAAHVANNQVAVGDLSTLISNVHHALKVLGTKGEAPAGIERREPAVSIRSSVKPDGLTCLVCGAMQKTLKRHLQAAHDLTPNDYRVAFDLRPDYPMIAPNYAEQRRALAHKIGLGHFRG